MFKAAKSSKSSRSVSLLATVGIAASMFVPVAVAAPALAQDATQCEISSAELKWGFKESFRSYVTSNIAKGDWQLSDGAAYETPEFIWSQASGFIAEDGNNAEVDFTGSIEFTGHNGLLDTTVSDPSLKIVAGKGVILIDLISLSMDDALVGDSENVQELKRIEFGTFDLPAPGVFSDGGVSLSGTQVPAFLTEAGAAAFGSYVAGDALDPITFNASALCAEPQPSPSVSEAPVAAPSESASLEAESDSADSGGFWWGIAAGVVAALLVAGVVLAVSVRRAKRKQAENSNVDDDSSVDNSGGSAE